MPVLTAHGSIASLLLVSVLVTATPSALADESAHPGLMNDLRIGGEQILSDIEDWLRELQLGAIERAGQQRARQRLRSNKIVFENSERFWSESLGLEWLADRTGATRVEAPTGDLEHASAWAHNQVVFSHLLESGALSCDQRVPGYLVLAAGCPSVEPSTGRDDAAWISADDLAECNYTLSDWFLFLEACPHETTVEDR